MIINKMKTPVLIHPRESNKVVFSKISTLESGFEKMMMMIIIIIFNTSIAHFNIVYDQMRLHKNETYIKQKLYYLMYVLTLFTVNCYTNN